MGIKNRRKNAVLQKLMYQDAFKKLKPNEVSEILETYNPLFDGSIFESADTTIMAQDISFYPGLRYLDIADYSCVPPMRRFVVDGPGTNVVLDWSNAPIYQINQDLPIHLDSETVCDYVRFFFNHVRGKNGRFLIAESIDDIRWRDDPPPAARKTIGEMLMPMIVADAKGDGGYFLSITVMFKDSLFQCDVDVSVDGQIDLHNEKLLVEDMPVLDDAFGQ